MSWFTFALLTALFASMRDLLSKYSTQTLSPIVIAWGMSIFALPLLFVAMLWEGQVTGNLTFVVCLVAASLLLAICLILYAQALSEADLSLVIPLAALTPFFAAILAPILIGESLSLLGTLGISMSVLGAYVLTSARSDTGGWMPFVAIRTQSGPRLMLLVAFCFSIVALLEKLGIQNSAPLLWTFWETAFVTVMIIPMMKRSSPHGITETFLAWRKLAPLGFVVAIMLIVQNIAFSLGPVAYVLALKRLSVLVGVIAGALLFQEGGIRERLLGASLMIFGTACISLT